MRTTIYRFIIPYLYLPDYMKQYGYEVSVSAVLISAIGIAQTVGMIGLGYLGDRSWMNINICYSICMLGKKEIKIKYVDTSHLVIFTSQFVVPRCSLCQFWSPAITEWCWCASSLDSRSPAHSRLRPVYWSVLSIWTISLVPTVWCCWFRELAW